MTSEQVVYLGRNVPKEGFRVFIYDSNGEQKLVESWDEYQREIESGVWFATKDGVPKEIKEEAPITNKNSDKRNHFAGRK